LSGGQQQRVAIARALITDPAIILADEPTGNLDSRSADVVIRVFRELAARGKTILIVTHDPSLTSRVDRTVIISDGEIVDETVAGALPSLDHPQMLQATHDVEKRVYEAGEIILRQGEPVDYFYMVGDGQVVVEDEGGTAVTALSTHQFFGEVELMGDEKAVATVRAGDDPVELALLPKAHFFKIMAESPPTTHLLLQVAKERRTENMARRQLQALGHQEAAV
jgi:ABC-type multidrug transport system ATPase subunit